MKNTLIEPSVVRAAMEQFDVTDLNNGSIRQIGGIVKTIEERTGEEFVHLEMGVPGLPPEKVGIAAEHAALDAGAADVESDGDVAVIYTDPNELSAVRDSLEAAGCTFLSAEREMVPTTTTEITDPDTVAKVRKLIDWLEDYDDSQNVFHDAELPEEEEEE